MPTKTLTLTSRTTFVIVALVILAGMALARLHTLHEPFERDITGFSYMAHQLIEGKRAYIDVWDHKPPTTPAIFGAFQLLFGYTDWAIFMLGVVFNGIVLIGIGLIARELIGGVPALVAMALYGLIAQDAMLQMNQPDGELLINAFKLMGIFALLRAREGIGRRRWELLVLAGLLIGVSSTIKMMTIFTWMGLAFILLTLPTPSIRSIRERIGGVGLFGLAAAATWGVLLIGLWHAGALVPFWEAVFIFNRMYAFNNPVSTVPIGQALLPPEMAWERPLIWLTGVFLLTLLFPEHRRKKLVLVILLLAAAMEVAAPWRFFPHYYQLLVPFLILTATWALTEMVTRASGVRALRLRPRFIALLLALIIGVPLLIGNIAFLTTPPNTLSRQKYGNNLFPISKAVGTFLGENLRDGLTILAFNDETGLYYHSKRNSPSPFFYFNPLLFGEPKARAKRIERFLSGMYTDPPDVFIDMPKHSFNGFIPPALRITLGDLLRKDYRLFGHMGPFVISCHRRHVRRENGQDVCAIER